MVSLDDHFPVFCVDVENVEAKLPTLSFFLSDYSTLGLGDKCDSILDRSSTFNSCLHQAIRPDRPLPHCVIERSPDPQCVVQTAFLVFPESHCCPMIRCRSIPLRVTCIIEWSKSSLLVGSEHKCLTMPLRRASPVRSSVPCMFSVTVNLAESGINPLPVAQWP